MLVFVTRQNSRVDLDFVKGDLDGVCSATHAVLTAEQFAALTSAYITSDQYGERTVMVDEAGGGAGKPISEVPSILKGHAWISEWPS
jgi:hypothetical protein